MASTTTSAGGNVSMVISCSAGNISRSGSTVTADITASVKMATSSYTYNSIAVWINGTKYTVFDSKSGKNHTSSGTTYSKTANVTWNNVADTTTSISYTCGYGWNAWSPSNKTSLSDSFSFSANTGSFNLNILNPDGSEPYSTGEAGSVEFSSNGGSSYSRLYNEPASSYVIGTAFRLRNFTPGTGRKYSSISGVSGGSGTSADPWYVSQGSSTTISISTAWQTYTIAYSANGGTGAPGNQTKTYNQNLTLSSTKPTKSNTTATGYTVTFNGNGGTASKASQAATDTTTYTFNNWKDGAGTTYAAGGTYTKNQADTLTAQWTSSTTKGAVTTATATKSSTTSTRTVTYNANGGYCGTASANSTATVSYSCSGWYTATSGGTKRASSGGSYTPTASETVYAQWTSSTGTYSALTLPTPQRTGYTFNGWYSAASGGTKIGDAGASYTPDATKTIYAQWTATTYTVKVNPNGGTWNSSTSTTTKTGTYGSNLSVPAPTRSGYKFLGWVPVDSSDETLIEVFCHGNNGAQYLFSNKDEAKSCNTRDKFSILSQLAKIKGTASNYNLTLKYDSLGTAKNNWTQTSNPATESIAGYTAVSIAWTTQNWGGLAPSSSAETFIDGSPGATTWFYAIGANTAWSGGIPGPSAVEKDRVYLYLKGESDLSNITEAITGVVDSSNNYIIRHNITLKAIWLPDQATAWTKTNGTWVKGKVWVKINGTWQKAKTIQGKVSGTWKKNK